MFTAKVDTEECRGRGLLRAVVFDLDGVLVDTEHLQQRAYIATFERLGVQLSHADLLPWLGHREEEILRALVGQHALSANLQQLQRRRKQEYLGFLRQKLEPMPGAVEVVREAYRCGVSCAVASSSGREEVETCLSLLGLTSTLEAVVTGSDVRNGKPSPEVYCKVLAELGVAPSECLAIEDSEVGVAAAIGAGIAAVAVPNELTASQDFSAAVCVAPDIGSVLRIIKSRLGRNS